MYQFTTESIGLQDKKRFAALQQAFQEALDLYSIHKGLPARDLQELETRAAEELKKLFNLNVILVFGRSAGEAYVMVQPINTRHIFTPAEYKDMLDSENYDVNNRVVQEMLDAGKGGAINLEKAWMSGIFSEIESYIYIDIVSLLKGGMDQSGQLTSVLLHEVGHIVTYFIYCANTAAINQTLMNYNKEAVNRDTYIRTLRYATMNLDKPTKAALDALDPKDNRLIFSWKVSKFLYAQHASHSSHSIYNNTAAESLADNFAVRCGYAQELVEALTGLHKRGKKTTSALYTSDLSVSSFNIFKMTLVSTGNVFTKPILSIAARFVYAANVSALTFMHLASVFKTKLDERPEGLLRYDGLFHRVKRMREQLVSNLRGETNPKVLKLMLAELEAVEKIMPPKNTWESFEPVVKWVDTYITSAERRQIILEQNLANIVNNPLVISSAKALVALGEKK